MKPLSSGPLSFENPTVRAPVGQCIYCGSDGDGRPLGKEHVIPRALRGALILPRASCFACGRITGEFERQVMRDQFGIVRRRLNYPIKSVKEHPKTFTVVPKHGGPPVTFPISRQPAEFKLPILQDPPKVFTNEPLSVKTGFGWRTYIHTPSSQAIGDALRDSFITTMMTNHGNFFRMLAKIAHAYAVAVNGIDSMNWYLRPLIIDGIVEQTPLYIGRNTLPITPVRPARTSYFITGRDFYVGTKILGVVQLQFFSMLNVNTPVYAIVVGDTKTILPDRHPTE